MKKQESIIVSIISLVLLATTAIGFLGWFMAEKQNSTLKSQLVTLHRQEKRSAILRSVSKQMEEIAIQQKEISDEQREEALLQTKLANELRERSETERQKAILAQENAKKSEMHALEAYDQAEHQRQIAEVQRIKAEHSKRVTDTLTYMTLGRSLGSQAITQFQAGNTNLGNLLSYASYLFTQRYHGNLYYPSVYQALSLSSTNQNQWTKHEGATMGLDISEDNNVVSVSNYGEILLHVQKDNNLKTTVLFKNSNYDFRDVYYSPKGTIYALSRTGHLIVKTAHSTEIIELAGMTHPIKLSPFQNKTLIIAENSIAFFDTDKNKVLLTKQLDYRITFSGREDSTPILFDNKGRMHLVKDMETIITRKVPVPGNLTAYTVSNSLHCQIFGMRDGTIFIVDKDRNVRRLVGHQSRISKLKIKNNKLYSSSYDGTLNLWVLDSQKLEPITLYKGNNWINHFIYDKSKNHIWIGDTKGNLIKVLISVPVMAEMIKNKLKRDFTQSEWKYYIGQDMPYESFLFNRKEAKP